MPNKRTSFDQNLYDFALSLILEAFNRADYKTQQNMVLHTVIGSYYIALVEDSKPFTLLNIKKLMSLIKENPKMNLDSLVSKVHLRLLMNKTKLGLLNFNCFFTPKFQCFKMDANPIGYSDYMDKIYKHQHLFLILNSAD